MIEIVGNTVRVASSESAGSFLALGVDLAVPATTSDPAGCEYAEGT